MKILQIVPRFPLPMDDGGKIGIANIYKQFSLQGNEVHLISLNHLSIENKHIEDAKRFGKVDIIEHDTKNTTSRIIKYFLLNKSIYIEKNYSEALFERIKKLISDNTYDIIHCDHTSMAQFGLNLSHYLNIPVGLRLHNIEYLIWKRYYENTTNIFKRIFLRQQYKILKSIETEYISKMDICFPITEEDKNLAKNISPESKLKISTAGVDLDYWRPSKSTDKKPYSLVIATTFNWVHNKTGLLWFLDEVLPLIKKRFPNVNLNIIGKEIPEEFSRYSNVNIIGYVNDLREYLEKFQIYIAPLFVGGGIRIKILEAMSMGLPVVCTKVSSEGIKASRHEGLIVSDDPIVTSQNIIELFENDETRNSIQKLARTYIEQNHTWESNVKIMLNEYKKLLVSKNKNNVAKN